MCGVINKIEWRAKDKGLGKEGRHKENLDKVESGTKIHLKKPLYISIQSFRFMSNSYDGLEAKHLHVIYT